MTTHPAGSVALSDLLGLPVYASDGRRVGKVSDLEVLPRAGYRVDSIIVSRFTFLGRFALVRGESAELRSVAKPRLVPWSEVERIDSDGVRLRARRPGPIGPGEGSRRRAGEAGPGAAPPGLRRRPRPGGGGPG